MRFKKPAPAARAAPPKAHESLIGSNIVAEAPLAGLSFRRECLLDVPARSWQPLERGLASGGPVPAATRLAFPGLVRVADQQLDDAFVDLAATGGRVCTRLVDPSGAAIVMRFDPVFTACVIYTPPHREALCIEPWTVVPGAPPFSPALGWRVLEAGEPLIAGLTISVE